MKIDDRTTWLEDALDFAGRETRFHVVEALYCHLHNTGQALAGNTAENDVEWLAERLWVAYREANGSYEGRWDVCKEQDYWRGIASVCVRELPRLQQRIANRMIELSKVMRDIARAEIAAAKAKKRGD